MSTITTRDGTQIYFNECGAGQSLVFSHGWPLSVTVGLFVVLATVSAIRFRGEPTSAIPT
jgi:pimeloyl-ACP methyl ester carboxylesterase